MKVLLLNLPFSGHVNPTLGLAQELIEKGHEVTYILSPEWESTIQSTGATFIPYDNSPEGEIDWTRKLDILNYVYQTAKRIASSFDCIIYEELFYLGKELAEAFNIPAIRLLTTFALNSLVWNEFVADGGISIKLLKFKFYRQLYTRILTKGISVHHKDFIHEIVNTSPLFNIVYTAKEFQLHANTFPPQQYCFVGPNVQRKEKTFRIDLKKETKPIIYISFGTIVNDCAALYQLFIEAFRDSEVLVILSIGKSNISELENIPAHIIIENSIPQLYVLKHANVFITHGGMNSVNEALYNGVPLIVMPGAAAEYASTTSKSIFPTAIDQTTISRRINELDLGVVVQKKLTVEQLKRLTFDVMKDPVIKAAVSKMKEAMQKTGGNQQAVKLIEKVINERIPETKFIESSK